MARYYMKPPDVADLHRDLCRSAGCSLLDQIDYDDPCAACPNGHFGPYEVSGCADAALRAPSRRGDQIASIAQPIATAIDAVLGTSIRTCGGCKQMQKNLNAGMPLRDAIRKRFSR